MVNQEKLERIRELNDELRVNAQGGVVLVTSGFSNLFFSTQIKVMKEIQTFDDFSFDPYGERDFGSITVDDIQIFWKIDYYAMDMLHGSEDPANPEITKRVLTIYLANEH